MYGARRMHLQGVRLLRGRLRGVHVPLLSQPLALMHQIRNARRQ